MAHTGPVYNQPERVVVKTREVVKHGASLGSALAIAISWSVNKSVLWAIIPGIFSWFYVLYFRRLLDDDGRTAHRARSRREVARPE